MNFVLLLVFNIDYIGNGIEDLDFGFGGTGLASQQMPAFPISLVIEYFVSKCKISNVPRMRSVEGVVRFIFSIFLIFLRFFVSFEN